MDFRRRFVALFTLCGCLPLILPAVSTQAEENRAIKAEQFRRLEQRNLPGKERNSLRKGFKSEKPQKTYRIPAGYGAFSDESIAGVKSPDFCFAVDSKNGYPVHLSLKDNKNLLANAAVCYPLWEMETVDANGKKQWTGPYSGKFSYRFHEDRNGMRLIYTYPQMTVNVDVKRNPDGFVLFGINVCNQDKNLRLDVLDFPKLALKPYGKPKQNFLVIPFRRGCLKKLTDFVRPQFQQYPLSSARFQMVALYDSVAEKGIYLSTDDNRGYAKFFNETYIPEYKVCLYSLRRFPEDRGKGGNQVAGSFHSILGIFDGDWYDAAQIYRSWWKQQKWAKRGPLYSSDVPDFLKHAPVFLRFYLRESKKLTPAGMLYMAKKWTDFLPGRKIPATLYHYSAFVEPTRPNYPVSEYYGYCAPAFPGLVSALEEMNRNGIRTSVYLQSEIYNQYAPENKALEVSNRLDENGKPQLYVKENYIACRRVDVWRKRYLEMCSHLLKMGFSGVYMDTFGKSISNYECYDTRHGHSAGGGNIDFVSQQILGRDVQKMLKQQNPDFYNGGEACTEGFAAILDYKLNAVHAYPDMIPLERVLYGDYFLSHGRSVRYNMEVEAKPMMLDFLEGIIFGRFFNSPPSDEAGRAFLKELIDRTAAGIDYLRFGQMLKPLKFSEKTEQVVLKEPRNVKISAWQNSVFRSYRDGSIGIAVAYFGMGKGENKLLLPSASVWGIRKDAKIYRLHPDGNRTLLGTLDSLSSLPLSLEENGVDFFILEK